VLTEPNYFLGSIEHLRAVKAAVKIPVLRKDFIFDPWQIEESAAYGADVVLLIVAALKPSVLRSLYEETRRLGMEALVEAHTVGELRQALDLENAIIGINCRNLSSLKTNLATARRIAPMIPENRQAVAESGIRSNTDIADLATRGYSGFLVGHALLQSGSPGTRLAQLLKISDSCPGAAPCSAGKRPGGAIRG